MELNRFSMYNVANTMTITLPDDPATLHMGESEIRLELACSLFARGKISSRRAAAVAGVDYSALLDALAERRISYYTAAMLREDIETLDRVLPKNSLPPV